MATTKADGFIEALRRLEEEGDLETLVSLFAEDAELSNPHVVAEERGREGARRFWHMYRDSFADVQSSFRNVVETDDTVVLEWSSRGHTTHGGDFTYDGVSILHFTGGAIDRFKAYFDPGKLRTPLSHAA